MAAIFWHSRCILISERHNTVQFYTTSGADEWLKPGFDFAY